MSALAYAIFAAIAFSGAAAIISNSSALRRRVVWFYLGLMAFLAFAIFFAGPRPAYSRITASGKAWTEEVSAGALAMHHSAMVSGGMLFLIAVVLAILVLRRK